MSVPNQPNLPLSVFCWESPCKDPQEWAVVLNHNFKLRAAVIRIPVGTPIGSGRPYIDAALLTFVRWIGRTCKNDLIPRRQAQNVAFDD